MNPVPVAARPASPALPPWLAGTDPPRQVRPPSVLSQVTVVRGPASSDQRETCPDSTMSGPWAAAPVMLTMVPSWTGSRASAAVIRVQRRPSRDVQITPVASATFWPAASQPLAVRVSTWTWSAESVGVMPVVAVSVQDWASGLVQMACGPTASQPPVPPARSWAGWPGAGSPPSAPRTVAVRQVLPASAETKNWPRVRSPPAWLPTATTVLPTLATRVSVWNTPWPDEAGPAGNWAPAAWAAG